MWIFYFSCRNLQGVKKWGKNPLQRVTKFSFIVPQIKCHVNTYQIDNNGKKLHSKIFWRKKKNKLTIQQIIKSIMRNVNMNVCNTQLFTCVYDHFFSFFKNRFKRGKGLIMVERIFSWLEKPGQTIMLNFIIFPAIWQKKHQANKEEEKKTVRAVQLKIHEEFRVAIYPQFVFMFLK